MLLALAAAFAFAPVVQGPEETAELARWQATRDYRLQWWREARFGMFVHFGLYAAAGGSWNGKTYPQHYAEWIQNWAAVPSKDYAAAMKPRFAPAVGCTDAWAELAEQAGMRYAVMTSKHHDGFTLFTSKADYSRDNPITGGTNISPDGRDLAREFATSMRARGIRPGFYYSLLDWQHPDAYPMALPVPPSDRRRDHGNYLAYVRTHVEELASNYGDLATLWFDYSDPERQGAAWGASQLLALLREKQPRITVNNRLFLGLENKNGDFGTPEKYVPPTGLPGMDWEVNHTLNESYGYSAHDQNWKDTRTVVRLLVDVVSKGGNLLLNIGPDAHGAVPEPAQRTLRGVGSWMKTHGAAIFGSTASPFARLPWGRATQKQDRLFLFVFDWPTDGRLAVPMHGAIRAARVLGATAPLPFARDAARDGELVLQVPTTSPDADCPVIELELAGAIEPLAFAVHAGDDGGFVLLPHDAVLTGPSLRVEQQGAIEDVRYNLGYWLDVSATASWPLAIDRGGDYTAVIELACADASAGAKVELAIGSARATFTVPATGGWQSYRELELGTVQLEAGRRDCVLRAIQKPGEAVVNVRSLRLRPKR